MAKLTLSVDAQVVSGAKRYAKLQGVSVSELVESWLPVIVETPAEGASAPVLRSVRGVLKSAEPMR